MRDNFPKLFQFTTLKSEPKKLLHDYSIDHLTVDIEYEGETCVAEDAETSLS
jgi:hypothetical protein